MQHLTDAQFCAQGEALDKALAEHTREHNRRLFADNEMMRRKYEKDDKTMNEQTFTSPTFKTETERDLAIELCREIASDAVTVDLSQDFDVVGEEVH